MSSVQPIYFAVSMPPADSMEKFCGGELGFGHIQDVFEKAIQHPRLVSVHPQAQEIGL